MTTGDDFERDQRLRQSEKILNFKRRVPVGDLFTDRHFNAQQMGFGEGTTMYDSVVVLGDVKVGKNVWIGPNVILDGSGKLEIGNNCTIGAGVQIYTHDSIKWALSGGTADYEYSPTKIGSNCFIGPNSIIVRGVVIEDCCTIGPVSFVTKSLPTKSKYYK